MLLATHDDPATAADFLLEDLERDLIALGALPPEGLSHYRERVADVAANLNRIAAETPRKGD